MAALNLTTKELEFTAEALREYLSDLRTEIADTDDKAYKQDLKDKEATLKTALAKMEA